jgi:hypothetical protein
MTDRLKISLLTLIVLAGILLAWGVVQAAPALVSTPEVSQPSGAAIPAPLPNQPEVQSPNISFIDSSTASCILPRRNTGVCLMTWNYMYADASPNYMITMTVGIDDHARARFHGFFQTYMYVPGDMMAFQVQCGAPGAGGDPNLGASHSYVLRGRDSSGLSSANYGSVTCPADVPIHTFLPLLKKLID